MSGKVNILGTDYLVETRQFDDDRKLTDANGYIEFYSKKIILRELHPNCLTIENFELQKKKTKRHEIAHAFLFESGLYAYADDELLVDWIALQFPKLLKAMQEVGAMPDAES